MPTSQRRFGLQWNNGGITSLRLPEDVYDTEYIWPGETLGDVIVRYRVGDGQRREAAAFASGDIRNVTVSDDDSAWALTYSYAGSSRGVRGLRDLALTVAFIQRPDGLYWTLHFKNNTAHPLELGDVMHGAPQQRARILTTQCANTRWIAENAPPIRIDAVNRLGGRVEQQPILSIQLLFPVEDLQHHAAKRLRKLADFVASRRNRKPIGQCGAAFNHQHVTGAQFLSRLRQVC